MVTLEGKLKIGKKHHFLGDRKSVEAAGTARFTNGKLKNLTNYSGHYQPSIAESFKFPEIFRQLGLKTKGASLEYQYLDNTGKVIYKTKYINE